MAKRDYMFASLERKRRREFSSPGELWRIFHSTKRKRGELTSLLQRKQENIPSHCLSLTHMAPPLKDPEPHPQRLRACLRHLRGQRGRAGSQAHYCRDAPCGRDPPAQVVEGTFVRYGILEECVEEVVAAVPA